ncbi:MAG TPA: hypothetical protein VGR59_06500 [Gemmatimonadaceae bacterium]|nr:hypothetical protein [Gemmatimonadaceae bacterium]
MTMVRIQGQCGEVALYARSVRAGALNGRLSAGWSAWEGVFEGRSTRGRAARDGAAGEELSEGAAAGTRSALGDGVRSSPARTAIPPASTSMATVNGGKRMLEISSLPDGPGGAVNANQQYNT